MIQVLDENARIVTNAVAWLDGRKWEADPKDGRIQIPFTATPGRRPIILSDADGRLASLAEFEHHAETYELEAQFHLDPEQCVAGNEALLAMRSSLRIGNQAATPELLADARLTLTTTTLDGVSSSTEVLLTQLSAARVLTHAFRVPERLGRVTATLQGRIDPVAGGDKRELSVSRSWEINGIEWTANIKDAFLRRSGERYWVEVRGKNGEPMPDHPLPMTFHRRGFNNTVTISLRTDAQGRIDLGALAEITRLEANPAPDIRRSWPLETSAQTRPRELHARVGQTVRIPWSPQGRPDAWSLLELRGGTYATDQNDAVRGSGNVLEIDGLAAGDYSLRLRDPESQ